MADLLALARDASERAGEIEDLGRLPDDLAAGLVDSGMCRAMAPRELGADELPPPDLLPILEDLAHGESSLGWCAMIAATTSLAGGFLPPDAAEEIYGPSDAWTGGFAAPVGKALPVPGGLRVEGRWAWGSGSHHCTRLGGGTIVVDDAGTATPRSDGLTRPFVFFTPDQWRLLDTWDVLGMRGTGSTDYVVDGALVPDGRWFEIGQPPVIDRPVYRFPFYGALAIGVASVALGVARRAIDELVALAPDKRPAGSSRTLAERPPIQAQVAEALAAYRSARLLLHDATENTWVQAEAGEPPPAARLELRLAATNAAIQAAAVVDRCYHAAGGTSVYRRHPLEKLFRDVHVATQHAMVAPRLLEVIGRATFGLDTSMAQI